MNKKEILEKLEKNSDNLPIRKLVSDIIETLCDQAIKIFFKEINTAPELPNAIYELQKILGCEEIDEQAFIEVVTGFFFKKVREAL